jgi:hypothetical protein
VKLNHSKLKIKWYVNFIACGTLSGFLLLLLFCCWKSQRLTSRVTWRLEVQPAVIGSTSARLQWARARQREPKNRKPHNKQFFRVDVLY